MKKGGEAEFIPKAEFQISNLIHHKRMPMIKGNQVGATNQHQQQQQYQFLSETPYIRKPFQNSHMISARKMTLMVS
jgi:hypothetical protein